MLSAQRHEVDDADRSFRGLKIGLEHERSISVAAPRPTDIAGRRQPPPPVAVIADEGGETRAGVKPRGAEPIDRGVRSNEGGGVCVSD